MGDTIWIMSKKTYNQDDDRSVLMKNIDYLDSICGQLGQKSISGYLDYADYEANLGEDWPGDEAVNQKKKWYDSGEGLEVFTKLYDHIKSAPGKEELSAELNDCIERLKHIVKTKEPFHLAVIM